ncbi:hypothetical protein BCR42DRAFT_427160 [Absidia repens]|uniref:Uncharacterized protein n=1 Tax=Absidia repens TaxID=90262 RepID=A0A1X2I001_9FUNG|nr:hypothetical protein BCR42DRAFT_427160 [Absidia repens]
MMLKSKASKNEDRLYAILPLSKYKNKLNQVADWKISSTVSVKLKLFEIMDTRDKWTLLFSSGQWHSSHNFEVLPTFCVSSIYWDQIERFVTEHPCNFDINHVSSAITLHHHTNELQQRMYYLQLMPKEYYVKKAFNNEDNFYISKNTLYNRLQVNKHSIIVIVRVPQYDFNGIAPDNVDKNLKGNTITLLGCFVENKWTLCSSPQNDFDQWDHHYDDENGTFFNIY